MFNLRPHHLICILCFKGKGYNQEFTENLWRIYRALNKNASACQINIVQGVDDVCAKCPVQKSACCKHEEKVTKIDNAYSTALQLRTGDVLSIIEVRNKVRDFLTLDDFRKICRHCDWQEYGICEKRIKTIKKSM